MHHLAEQSVVEHGVGGYHAASEAEAVIDIVFKILRKIAFRRKRILGELAIVYLGDGVGGEVKKHYRDQ